jgi:hypothetical protein
LPILVVSEELANSRMLYLPSTGLCLLLACGAGYWAGRGGAARLLSRASLAAAILGGGFLLMADQARVVEAGDECRRFLEAVRGTGFPVMVVPTNKVFPYSDREGDGLINDRSALFAPTGKAPPPNTELAILLNAPRMRRGIYQFWGSLNTALLPVYGQPGVDILFTEMFPFVNPAGSCLGPLLQDGVPVLKWNGDALVSVEATGLGVESLAARDIRKTRTGSLGTPELPAGRIFPSDRFTPIITLPLPADPEGRFQYRLLNTIVTQVIPADPKREGGRLVFDPWNEGGAGAFLRMVHAIRPGGDHPRYRLHPIDHMVFLCFIEQVKEDKIVARSRHFLLRARFPPPGEE